MPARTPADVDIQPVAAINAGDLEAAVAFYEPDAAFVSEPGKTVTGTEAIREVMTGFIASKPNLPIEVPLIVQSGDTALLHSKFAGSSTDAEGNTTDFTGQGIEVVGRQADGTWLFVIDNPHGAP